MSVTELVTRSPNELLWTAKNHTFTMFFLCEIILFSGLMNREKDQKIGADVNTTPNQAMAL